MSTDAIVVLKSDHKLVRAVFRAFANAGENATMAKGDLMLEAKKTAPRRSPEPSALKNTIDAIFK